MSKKPYFLEEISAQEVKKRILCVHGLNQNPEALKPLLGELSKSGIQVFLLHLPGHNNNFQGEEVTCETIENSYVESYDWIVNNHGSIDGFIGYSFGGLIGMSHVGTKPYDRYILLAPALKLRPITHGIKLALPFFNKIKSIPFGDSKKETEYRYHNSGVPSSIYQSFFNYYSRFKKNTLVNVSSTKGFVVCHPKDELIHSGGLRRWVEKNTPWPFFEASNSEAKFKKYNHLCFDQDSLGETEFSKLVKRCRELLLE